MRQPKITIKTFHALVYVLLSMLLASCGSRYHGMRDLFSYAINGAPDVELTQQQIEDFQYAAQYVRLGKDQPQALLVLGFDDQGRYQWVSGQQESLVTKAGRVIASTGLPTNIEFVSNVAADPLQCLTQTSNFADCPTLWQRTIFSGAAENARMYSLVSSFEWGQSQTMTLPDGTNINARTVTETVKRQDDNSATWQNHFWLEAETGRVVKSVQTVAPNFPQVKLTEVKPYQKDLEPLAATSAVSEKANTDSISTPISAPESYAFSIQIRWLADTGNSVKANTETWYYQQPVRLLDVLNRARDQHSEWYSQIYWPLARLGGDNAQQRVKQLQQGLQQRLAGQHESVAAQINAWPLFGSYDITVSPYLTRMSLQHNPVLSQQDERNFVLLLPRFLNVEDYAVYAAGLLANESPTRTDNFWQWAARAQTAEAQVPADYLWQVGPSANMMKRPIALYNRNQEAHCWAVPALSRWQLAQPSECIASAQVLPGAVLYQGYAELGSGLQQQLAALLHYINPEAL